MLNIFPATHAQRSGPGPGELGHASTPWRPGADVGASGAPPVNRRISDRVLREAGDPARLAASAGPLADLPDGPLGIPGMALDAYRHAQSALARSEPGCHLPWSLVAGIGRIESDHARGGRFDTRGTTTSAILGPVLDGTASTVAIPDTDGGRLDGDRRHDRAVGPMQFIPSTWARLAGDGNGDGTASPHNVYDASLAAGRYLCAAGGDLSDPARRATAVFSYNHSDSYVRTVLVWSAAYAKGVRPVDVAAAAPDVDGIPPLAAPGGSPPAARDAAPRQAAPQRVDPRRAPGHPVPAAPRPRSPGPPTPGKPGTPAPSTSGAPSGTPTSTPPPGSPSGTPTSTSPTPSPSAPPSSPPSNSSTTTSPTPSCPPTTSPTPTPSPTNSPTTSSTSPTTTSSTPPGCPTPSPTSQARPSSTPRPITPRSTTPAPGSTG